MIGPRHLQGAQRRHLVSQVRPPLLLHLDRYFAAQLGSFLLIYSQLLLHSAASDSDLMACRRACPHTPIPLRSLVVDVATNPLHPTSTGSTWACQPRCPASAAMSEYFSLLRSYACPTAASHGTVSSTMNSDFWDGFAGSCPALTKGVVFECLGIGGGRALLVVLLPSRVIASSRRTWLCLQV